jgi:Yip1 domain
MSDQAVQSTTEVNQGLTQWQRVINIFTAPSKTFEDIKRGNRSWWLPFLIMVVIGYLFFAAVTMKIGWNQVAQNAIHLNPKAEERMQQAPPAQRDMTMKITQSFTEGAAAASPVFVLLIAAVMALVLWGTVNFLFAGKAQFPSIFAVMMYGFLPGTIKTVLGTIVTYTGMAPESFNIRNFAPTNLGAFLNPLETNSALYSLASAIDFTTIWTLVVVSIGLAIVAGVKRSSGYIAVFGWWAIVTLGAAGWAAVMG